jgi:hypothetical protein
MPTAPLPQPLQHERIEWPGSSNPAEGRVHVAFTDKGRPIKVWIPAVGNDKDHQYFCHGLTLDTHRRFKYSVYSGRHVATVLEDEYQEVDDLGAAAPGDVVAFFTGQDEKNVSHTCQIVNCQSGNTPKKVMVWTKNGAHPEQVSPLKSVIDTYGSHFIVWRKV